MATVEKEYYLRQSSKPQNWTASQEKSIAKDFPFSDIALETPDQYVARTYLQFLWLPESIVPLEFLIPAIQRVQVASTSTQHPLHALLEPLLLTPRSVRNKYHVELSQILTDNGGAGEIEETTMWYVLNYEKFDHTTGSDDEARASDTWRKSWLTRMERREYVVAFCYDQFVFTMDRVLVQILLYMLKLTLPAQPQPERSPKRRKRKGRADEPANSLAPEDILESFMDKLSAWQHIQNLESTAGTKDNLDWMQIFCQDIIEPQFISSLPEVCELFRSKVFQTSVFSDGTSTRSSSPDRDVEVTAPSRASSRAGSVIPEGDGQERASSSRTLSRARSRSLSVSLAQEEKARAASVGFVKKRVLNREVSMSRAFKPKPKETAKPAESTKAKSMAPWVNKKLTEDKGVTLVEETPEKPRAMIRSTSKARPFALSTVAKHALPDSSKSFDDDDEEEIWELPNSSPDVLLLRPIEEEQDLDSYSLKSKRVFVPDTPSKRPRRQ
ncbi:hypothetical protein PC9H_006354 [Pleurotus ostreatus]|uniref:DNA replication regulator Sld3 C-terminal domain-containing protein n=1 Tax=Pleurotus ostreatus TaxID=5322 RepID=A0A8H6ZWI5_PLEOS|nr:uncharacterized protein PC9H_006354 [Pleurotus ostreatus]KAF7430645.1 hypothetical protein PC9H_006354 [Pleurotus ostreatus]KAJ8694963.1 hypothetical protein PTI98_007593 [Pleurotus ostreatus]